MSVPSIPSPTIHLNGTSRADLVEQQQQMILALYALQRKMRDAFPHGRDYPYGGYEEAREAACDQLEMVSTLIDQRHHVLDLLHKTVHAVCAPLTLPES